TTAIVGCVARRAKGRRNSHGVDGAILETRMGNTGKVLEAALREAGRSQAEVRHVASGAGAIQSRATGTQEGFRRRRTLGEAAGGPRTDAELCARCRATPMANGNAQEVPVAARPGAVKQPTGITSGRGPYQVVQPGLRSAWRQCQTHVEGAG